MPRTKIRPNVWLLLPHALNHDQTNTKQDQVEVGVNNNHDGNGGPMDTTTTPTLSSTISRADELYPGPTKDNPSKLGQKGRKGRRGIPHLSVRQKRRQGVRERAVYSPSWRVFCVDYMIDFNRSLRVR